jgi:hypothetical protein
VSGSSRKWMVCMRVYGYFDKVSLWSPMLRPSDVPDRRCITHYAIWHNSRDGNGIKHRLLQWSETSPQIMFCRDMRSVTTVRRIILIYVPSGTFGGIYICQVADIVITHATASSGTHICLEQKKRRAKWPAF